LKRLVDQIRGFVIDQVLSTSQFISILVFLGASAALYWRTRQIQADVVKGPSRARAKARG
ncbi:MAG TPA: hypothetical protein VM598_13030, partial [Bdellovibrionota bacterium]|nr:hypothetical protein [Bdellovibrionota bacterium]